MNFNSETDVRECDDIREELQPYLLSQYSASPTISKILKDFRTEIDAQPAKELFIKKIMDIDTAEGMGLDIWGNIVNIGRTITFQNGEKVTLDDTHYRKLLMYKALANITDASLATLNRMMPLLFDDVIPRAFNRNVPITMIDGTTYNSAPMHVVWVLDGEMSKLDLAVFALAGTMSLGAGVGWSIVNIPDGVFGFDGSELNPFNQGTFIDSGSIIVEPGTEGGSITYYSVIITQSEHQTISVVASKGGVTRAYTDSFSIEESGWNLTILCEATSGYLAGNLVINGIERTDGQVSVALNKDYTISATEAEQGSIVYINGTTKSYWGEKYYAFYSNENCTSEVNRNYLIGKIVIIDKSNGLPNSAEGLVGAESTTPRCQNATTIDVSNIDVSKKQSFLWALSCLYQTRKIIGLDKWNPISATSFQNLCRSNGNLTDIGDISKWKTPALLTMQGAFMQSAITCIDMHDWYTPNLTNVTEAFNGCSYLRVADISGIDTTNISSANYFLGTSASLKYIIMDSNDIKFSGNVSMPNPNNTCKYLVKASMVDAYKAHANWSSRASRIESIDNYNIVRVNGQITVTPKEE